MIDVFGPDGSPAFDVCECGDYRHQHVGPEHRGVCDVCGESTRAGDGCRRFTLWRAAATRFASASEHPLATGH